MKKLIYPLAFIWAVLCALFCTVVLGQSVEEQAGNDALNDN